MTGTERSVTGMATPPLADMELSFSSSASSTISRLNLFPAYIYSRTRFSAAILSVNAIREARTPLYLAPLVNRDIADVVRAAWLGLICRLRNAWE